ncbi:hypothetical protein BCV70DRAFT_232720 [Testicularia cyperi]|uniref:BHLH domain-containing protein n=1 Tax=Testicularia cyperi TaxID=1882483 RepID=A0A317XK04_9BASI|nr:hypothetical protein BCV70DRAFT_232720 [Testicularia cyperi]
MAALAWVIPLGRGCSSGPDTAPRPADLAVATPERCDAPSESANRISSGPSKYPTSTWCSSTDESVGLACTMMAANHYNGSRQHSHLPPHLSPLPPLEPSAERHHPYHLQSAGRRGSTDPILHASLAASASANAGYSHGHSLGHGHPSGSGSTLASPSPFDAPRRRSIQIEPTIPASHQSPFASPAHPTLHSSRYLSQTNSPTPLAHSHTAEDHATLPPMGQSEPSEPARPGQIQSNYQFGSYSAPLNPDYRHDDKQGHPRIPHLSAPDGEGGGPMIEPGMHIDSRRGSASSLGASKHLMADKDVKPYSRSPELRVSHKLAERKRRKEMKELFDDLRDQLPVDKGPKTSKWEILSKAVEHIAQIEQEKSELAMEVDRLRAQLGGGAAKSVSTLDSKSSYGNGATRMDYDQHAHASR